MTYAFRKNSITASGIGESPASHRLIVRSSRRSISRANALAERPERSIAERRISKSDGCIGLVESVVKSQVEKYVLIRRVFKSGENIGECVAIGVFGFFSNDTLTNHHYIGQLGRRSRIVGKRNEFFNLAIGSHECRAVSAHSLQGESKRFQPLRNLGHLKLPVRVGRDCPDTTKYSSDICPSQVGVKGQFGALAVSVAGAMRGARAA